MEIHVLDPQWQASHHSQIRAWSPFTILWSIHHDVLIFARSPLALYRSIETNIGFTNDIQQHVISDICQHCEPLARFVDQLIPVYNTYNMSCRAHTDQLPDTKADEAAHALLHEFQKLLNTHLPTVTTISAMLAHGDYGFTNDLQQMLLATAAQHIERLAIMHLLLTRWGQAHKPAIQ